MRVIRHVLSITDYQVVDLPARGSLVSVAVSRTAPDDLIDLWSIDEQVEGGRQVGVYIVGTGNPAPVGISHPAIRRFIGTVVTPCGLVWHVFEGVTR